MVGLLGIGLSLTLGICVRIGGYSAAIMLLLMYSALLLPSNHPFMDDLIIYSILAIGLTLVKSGHYWGLGKWWSKTDLVRRNPILE